MVFLSVRLSIGLCVVCCVVQADPVIEFKTLSRRDAFERMDNELKLLLATAPEERQAVR